MTTGNQSERRIVVGVDGSDGSKSALRWAMTQAALTGATLEAVASWQDPATSGYAYGWVAADGQDWATLTEKSLAETVTEVSDSVEHPVTVTTRVVMGHPAQILTDAGIGAQLLVVGTRGHGTFAGLLLGSVSQHCVQHAACPVVVVPTDAPTGEAAVPESTTSDDSPSRTRP
jgi:nucleotide-binding universal stress UspA family protein